MLTLQSPTRFSVTEVYRPLAMLHGPHFENYCFRSSTLVRLASEDKNQDHMEFLAIKELTSVAAVRILERMTRAKPSRL